MSIDLDATVAQTRKLKVQWTPGCQLEMEGPDSIWHPTGRTVWVEMLTRAGMDPKIPFGSISRFIDVQLPAEAFHGTKS